MRFITPEVLIKLRDLIALWIIRVEVILARKNAALANLTMNRLGRQHRKLHRLAIEYRQRTRQSQARGADVRIGLSAIPVYAAAESL